jgi:hypothetical protein
LPNPVDDAGTINLQVDSGQHVDLDSGGPSPNPSDGGGDEVNTTNQ